MEGWSHVYDAPTMCGRGRSIVDIVLWRPLPGVVMRSEPSCMSFFYNTCWEWADFICWGRSPKTIDLYHYTTKQGAGEIQRAGLLNSTRGSPVSYVTAFGFHEGSRLDEGVYFTRLEPQDVAVLVNNNYGSGDLYSEGRGSDVRHRHPCAEAVVVVRWPMRRILGRARYMVPTLNAETHGGLRRASPLLCGGLVSCWCCVSGHCCIGTCGCCASCCAGVAALGSEKSTLQRKSELAQPWRRPPEDYLAKVKHGKSDVWMVPAAGIELDLGDDAQNEERRPWGLSASVHLLKQNGRVMVPPRTEHARGDIRGLPPRKAEPSCAVM